ncbi:hypothetical protein V6N13_126743 [Hibiscus sabdariffa]
MFSFKAARTVTDLMESNRYEGGLKMIEELTTNAEQIQDELLREILSRNAGTDYLRRFLHGQTEKQLFKKNVPVVTYEDLKPYIDRIANGERSDILVAESITGFFMRHELVAFVCFAICLFIFPFLRSF